MIPRLSLRSALVLIGVLPLLFVVISSAWAGEPEALRETNRILEEEIKLAGRASLYLILDLDEKLLRIKGRGMELSRIPVEEWASTDREKLNRLYTLRFRPPVIRPKTLPGQDPTLEPIERRHMPTQYSLYFDPGLRVYIGPPARERTWLWMKTIGIEWIERIRTWAGIHEEGEEAASPAVLRLVLTEEASQSLAWSVVEGMPLLIKRPVH